MKNNRFIDIIKRTLGIGVLLPILFVGFICYLYATDVVAAGFIKGVIFRPHEILFGGAFDQTGLTKFGIAAFGSYLAVLSGWAIMKLSVMRQGPILRCINSILILALVIPVLMLVIYQWELIRYIHAMGVTFARIRGFVYGLILGCGIAVTIRYLYRHKTTNSA